MAGGFAGLDRRLELDLTGAYTAQDIQQGRRFQGQFPPEIMDQVAALLPTVCAAQNISRPPACADCFTYVLQATVAEGFYAFLVNDVNLMESPPAELIALLNQLLSSALEA